MWPINVNDVDLKVLSNATTSTSNFAQYELSNDPLSIEKLGEHTSLGALSSVKERKALKQRERKEKQWLADEAKTCKLWKRQEQACITAEEKQWKKQERDEVKQQNDLLELK